MPNDIAAAVERLAQLSEYDTSGDIALVVEDWKRLRGLVRDAIKVMQLYGDIPLNGLRCADFSVWREFMNREDVREIRDSI